MSLFKLKIIFLTIQWDINLYEDWYYFDLQTLHEIFRKVSDQKMANFNGAFNIGCARFP